MTVSAPTTAVAKNAIDLPKGTTMTYDDRLRFDMAALLFAKMLSQRTGEEKAFELLHKWLTEVRIAGFAQKKRQLGIAGETPKDLYDCFRAYAESIGGWYEIDEETEKHIDMRVLNCTLPEASQKSGWNCQEICEKIVSPLCHKASAIISPNLTWNLVEFNPDRRKGCRYRISSQA